MSVDHHMQRLLCYLVGHQPVRLYRPVWMQPVGRWVASHQYECTRCGRLLN